MRPRSGTLAALRQADVFVCAKLNGLEKRAVLHLLVIASRLGDGIVWYSMMIALPLVGGTSEWPHLGRLAAVGGTCLLLYQVIKKRTARPRPFEEHAEIRLRALPLDKHAFPSGHTMHAVAFTIVCSSHHPELLWFLAPFTLLVAASRVTLGLHYPSDVVVGAALGASIATLGVQL